MAATSPSATTPASAVPAAGVPADAPVTSTAHRSNNLDALRLVGALAVIFGHAYHIVGRPFENPVVAGYPVQTLGVVIFFSISGKPKLAETTPMEPTMEDGSAVMSSPASAIM